MMQRHVGIQHSNPPKAKTHTIGKKAKGIKPRAFMRRV